MVMDGSAERRHPSRLLGTSEAPVVESQPLVSVIIPTLNSAAGIQSCLESVKAQSYAFREAIVIDGGSTDGTASIAQEQGALVLVRNSGRSTARRLGAQAAHGDYLFFVDSDQLIDRGLIEECVALCEKDGLPVLRVHEFDEGQGIWARCRYLERRLAWDDDLVYPRFYRKRFYEEIGGHSAGLEDFMEDRDLYLRAKDVCGSVLTARLGVHNPMGRVNPLTLGIKGSRAAVDAGAFYRRNRNRNEGPWRVIRPRVVAFFSFHVIKEDPVAALMLTLYLPVVYGPRLLKALWERVRLAGS